MTENKKLVPKLRFPGFTDAWEQRKLGDVFKEYSEKNHDELPALTIIQGRGTVKRDESDRAIQYDKNSLSNYKMVKKDDFIMHLRSFEGGLERATCDGIISPAYHTFHGDKSDSRFYYAFFRSFEFINKKLVPHIYGIRDGKSIDIDGFKSIIIPYPSYNEQKKIGDYLDQIDYLITLQQRKLDHLKMKKNGLLQKMFPKAGSNVPQLRFPGFTDAWEQRKLGEVMDVGSVKRIHQSDWRNTGVRFLRARDIVSESKNEEPANYLYIDEKIYNKYSVVSGKVQKGDLLVTSVGTIGVPMLIKSVDPVYFKDGNIIWFKNNDALDGNFFYYSFTSKQVQNYIRASSGIGTVGTYTIDSGKKTPISFPKSHSEQRQLGLFFKQLDHLITLQQRKLDHLKKKKQALLQQMFI